MITALAIRLASFTLRARSYSDSVMNRDFRAKYEVATAFSAIPLHLSRILSIFGSDKEKANEHSYAATYERLFARLRFKKIKLLEIGFLHGSSFLAWRWFFPRGQIIAIDLNPYIDFSARRANLYRGDQTDLALLAKITQKDGPFDIVIDDGSHFNQHQLITFHALFPSMRDGAIYVIEDVQTSYWTKPIREFPWDGAAPESPEFANTCVGYFLAVAKYLNHAEILAGHLVDGEKISIAKMISSITFEHNLIIIRRGTNTQRSNWV